MNNNLTLWAIDVGIARTDAVDNFKNGKEDCPFKRCIIYYFSQFPGQLPNIDEAVVNHFGNNIYGRIYSIKHVFTIPSSWVNQSFTEVLQGLISELVVVDKPENITIEVESDFHNPAWLIPEGCRYGSEIPF